eukprot:scaffold994_cov226-Prasinococcus_capsulatus_cf.AAC.12
MLDHNFCNIGRAFGLTVTADTALDYNASPASPVTGERGHAAVVELHARAHAPYSAAGDLRAGLRTTVSAWFVWIGHAGGAVVLAAASVSPSELHGSIWGYLLQVGAVDLENELQQCATASCLSVSRRQGHPTLRVPALGSEGEKRDSISSASC